MQNLDKSLFSISHPTQAPRCGDMLVAEPFLREEYFNHAVITLIEYRPGSPAMGLVLNKPTGYTLGEAIEGIDDGVAVPISAVARCRATACSTSTRCRMNSAARAKWLREFTSAAISTG